jgi:pimeloyl-ACP methyl ester carboxylesterase
MRSWTDSLPAPRFPHVTETIATLREVVLMPRDIMPIVPDAQHGEDVVVLIHGFMASAGVFRPMRKRLEEEAFAHVASFSHAPLQSVPRIAKALKKVIDRVHAGARIHLVGHSLGGLVARWYVQELGGHERVVQTISLASPFAGTKHANILPILIGKTLTTESHILRQLRSRAHEFEVPHTSIVAEEDALVVPVESAIFPKGDVVALPGRGHNTLLYDDISLRTVIHRVRTR